MEIRKLLEMTSAVTRIASHANDDPDTALRKQLLMGVSIVIIPAGLIWGAIYLAFGEYIAASIPIGYSILSLTSMLMLVVTRRFELFRAVQLLLILFSPFILMLTMGGFHQGSVVFIWSVMAPFGALLYHRSAAYGWLLAYMLLLIVSAFAQPFLPAHPLVPESFVTFMFVLNIGSVSLITFGLVNSFVKGEEEALELLRLEKEKSERLLLNVLPKEIAPALKEEHGIIAQHYESASVLFADIVGFTQLSAILKPDEMVGLLNDIFSHFDSLVEKYNLEKIRTIGDNYMVAAGVPIPRDDHALALANMAVDLCDFIRRYPPYNGQKVNFRIGINSGPVVAGIIGRQKFHYDIWGDTVNTASRMESTGVPGRIQITSSTRQLLDPYFTIVPRGKISIKGKGEIETWFLEGKQIRSATG